MCRQPGVRDSHPQAHDATLHQPPAQTPPARPVRAERDGQELPRHPPGRVFSGSQRSRGH